MTTTARQDGRDSSSFEAIPLPLPLDALPVPGSSVYPHAHPTPPRARLPASGSSDADPDATTCVVTLRDDHLRTLRAPRVNNGGGKWHAARAPVHRPDPSFCLGVEHAALLDDLDDGSWDVVLGAFEAHCLDRRDDHPPRREPPNSETNATRILTRVTSRARTHPPRCPSSPSSPRVCLSRASSQTSTRPSTRPSIRPSTRRRSRLRRFDFPPPPPPPPPPPSKGTPRARYDNSSSDATIRARDDAPTSPTERAKNEPGRAKTTRRRGRRSRLRKNPPPPRPRPRDPWRRRTPRATPRDGRRARRRADASRRRSHRRLRRWRPFAVARPPPPWTISRDDSTRSARASGLRLTRSTRTRHGSPTANGTDR